MSPDSWGLERTKTPVERLFPREGPGALGEVNATSYRPTPSNEALLPIQGITRNLDLRI
jgi:hypothetical protein